jgi:hypothetical protein
MRFARTNSPGGVLYGKTAVTGTQMLYRLIERRILWSPLTCCDGEAVPHPKATLATSQASLLPEFRPRRWSGVKGLVS